MIDFILWEGRPLCRPILFSESRELELVNARNRLGFGRICVVIGADIESRWVSAQ